LKKASELYNKSIQALKPFLGDKHPVVEKIEQHFASLRTIDQTQVAVVVSQIRSAIALRPRSYKGDLHFYYPQHWIPEKIGREGWLFHIPNLGPKVSFSVFATESDPAFDDTFEGLKRNAEDLVRNQGGNIVDSKLCLVDGIEGIEYRVVLANEDEILSFLWRYQGGDYQFRVYATSRNHLEQIRPAINSFMEGFKMEVKAIRQGYSGCNMVLFILFLIVLLLLK
jgi:hypothetical protein